MAKIVFAFDGFMIFFCLGLLQDEKARVCDDFNDY